MARRYGAPPGAGDAASSHIARAADRPRAPPSNAGGGRAAITPRSRDRRGAPGRRPSPPCSPPTHSPLAEALTGAVVLPGDPGWDEARSALQPPARPAPGRGRLPGRRRRTSPPRSPTPARAGLRVAPQATGHNQGPLGDLEDTLLLNVAALQEVRVDPGARRVRVGAGVKWDRVGAAPVGPRPRRACTAPRPTSGIAGYSLGGGMGWLARKHGLQTNAVTALELVTADGELVRADAEHHAGPVLGAARRRRQLRRRDRDRVRRPRGRRALRRRAVLPVRALGRGAAHLERAAARRCPRSSCRGRRSCTSRRSPTCRRSPAGARSPS